MAGAVDDLTNDIEKLKKLIDSIKQSKVAFDTKPLEDTLKKLQNDEAIQFTLIYDPVKFDKYIPFAVLAWIDGNLDETLNRLEKEFSGVFLQKPFIAKNQIVLFLYSNNIFDLDNIAQQVRKVKGVSVADLFIPKKITFPQEWVKEAIKMAKTSEKLHLMYQTN